MATNKEQQIYELALKYVLDGQSLVSSLNKANKEYEGSLKKRTKLTEKQAKEVMNMLKTFFKQTLVQMEIEEKKSQKKRTEEHARDIQRRWDKRKKINAQNLKQEQAQERASAKKVAEARKNTFIGGFENFSRKLGTIASYGLAISAITAVTGAIRFAVTAAIELEAGFIDLAVKSGYTQREMGKVSEQVLNVAQSTRFSTGEITGAATALGKLGFEAEEVIKVLPNLANLAGATGESLQASAEILGKVINAYEYTADQSGVIADRMVDIFNNSALSLEKFNTAFSYVGSAAASTGTSFNELTAAMAVLSDRGVTASKIGTGLRNVFTKLGREGDTLRDIIKRVADGHLNFYEVAELVGRRAANQLFIMADSLDEFDEKIARATEDYGEAARAAAVQMDSFKSQYEILINTLKNYVAPEFDPDKKWRNSISDSMGFLATFNAMMGETNEAAYFSRITKQYPQFAKDLNEVRKEIGATATDFKLLTTLRNKLRKEGAKDEKGKPVSEKELDDYIDSINAFIQFADMRLLFGDSRLFIKELDKGIKAKIENDAEEAVITWQDAVQKAVGKITRAEDKNKFLETYFGEDRSLIGGMLTELKDSEQIDDDIFTELVKGLAIDPERFKKELKKYRVENIESYEKHLTDTFNETRGLIVKATGGTLVTDESDLVAMNIVANDKKVIKELIDEDKKNRDLICKDAPSLAKKLEIICEKTKSKRDRGEIGKIDSFSQLEEDYKTQKKLLEEQYKDIPDNDPVAKLKKNRELIALEEKFRDELNRLTEDYLEKQASLRDEFCKKYPDQCGQFDENIKRVQDTQIRDEAEGDRNLITLNARDIDDKADAYKRDAIAKEEYRLAIAEIDNKFNLTDRKNVKERKRLLALRNQISKDYYKTEISRAEDHLVELGERLKELETTNAISLLASFYGGDKVQIDLSGTEELIEKLKAEIARLKAEMEASQKEGSRTDNQDFDYFPLILQASEDVYNVYKMIGDQKLELLKQQVERELEVIQDRFDREGEIRNSALESGIISQEEATESEERARRNKIDKENKANKKLFEAQKKRDKEDAIFGGLTATAQAISNIFAKHAGDPVTVAILTSISAAAIAAQSALNVKAINSRKFVPQTYADGGLVIGKSHAEGGVPFTVKGRGGYEMEGGEFIVNKESTQKHLAELQRINSKTQKSKSKFATGGYVDTVNDSDDFNRLLLEALNKPVRAFVTNQDLAESNSEREALTKKTSY